MVSDALRRVMLAAEGAGELSGDDVHRGRAEHPVCGDVVQVDVRVTKGTVAELAWRATGCPACMAVAAAAPGGLRGVAVADAAVALRTRLTALGGLSAHERHAEKLLLRALESALAP